MSELPCIGLVAHFEGHKDLALPVSWEGKTTLSQLDNRTRALEEKAVILSPPAVLDPTWDSLLWRLGRLDRRIGGHSTINTASQLLMPEPATLSLDKLEAIVFGIPYRQNSQPAQPPPKLLTEDEDEAISVMVQRLCHVAGNRGYKLSHIPVTRGQIYATAVAVSIEIETTQQRGLIGRPGMPPPPGWPSPPRRSKLCCGCCSCTCHTAKSHGVINVTKPSKIKKFFRFTWARKMMCWRKKTDYSSDSSSSTV